MASIRMMTPYFGSGIDIWACMIATVMLSLMAGYYIGGMVADRAPRSDVLGAAVVIAGLFLCVIPLVSTPFLDWMLDTVGYDVNAALMSAVALMFLPMTLLSFFSPMPCVCCWRTLSMADVSQVRSIPSPRSATLSARLAPRSA
ncbi:MAG: hypothetical protein WDM79_05250 [Terricaulis sp.]